MALAIFLIVAMMVIAAFVALGAASGYSRSARRFFRTGDPLHELPLRQLSDVMDSHFERRRVLSFSEYRIFRVIEAEVAAARKDYRVFAQTSLGEVLASSDDRAFRAINSKRVDMLVIDSAGWPIVAIEYQGAGHYQQQAAARDAIKKEALRKAGVRYLEIFEGVGEAQIRQLIREQLGRAAPDAGEIATARAS